MQVKKNSVPRKPLKAMMEISDESSCGPMSNYSVYFLSQNAVYTNCSVYSLISGRIMAQDFDSLTWQNDSLQFLPAYYVTNCSISNLVQQIRNQNSTADDVATWLNDYYENPYNVADNGDSFVALLYMLSGSCVSCWMLMFLILLSPKHKRKPLLTSSSLLVYSSVLTAILVKVTQATRVEYYADSLDLVELLGLTVEKPFTICLAFSELLTNLAYLQLILKFSRHRLAKFNTWFVSLLIAACFSVYCVLISRVETSTNYVTLSSDTSQSGHISLNIVFMAWFAGNLGYYTICGTATAPRGVAYARKLLPLAFLTWFNLALYLVVGILMLSLWSDEWLINAWVGFLPTLLKMYVLITCWEWFYSIRHAEQKLELGDVLGRRISLDNDKAFNNDKTVRGALFQNRFSSILNFLAGKDLAAMAVSDAPKSDRASQSQSSSDYIHAASPDHSGSHDLRDDASSQEVQIDNADLWASSDEASSRHTGPSPGHVQEPHIIGACDSQSASSGPQTGTRQEDSTDAVQMEEPPSFTPHPGYNIDDYWEEKRPRV